MNGVLTSAPVLRLNRRRSPRQPRPLPGWVQFTALLLCVLQSCGPVTPKTFTTYDADGNVLTLTDPNGHVTTNTYDLLNRLLTSTDAAGIVVANTYDQVGNKLTVTDGKNQMTSFTYDGLNRNTTVTDATGNITTLRYDALNKTQRIDALGQTTTYLYDVRNRLSNVVYASSASANSQRNYLYDSVGNLLSVTEPSKTAANVAYTYDALNRAITETSGGLTHTYIYDLAGNRLGAVYGGTNRTITSTYDALNRLGTMTESGRVSSYAYDLNGNIVQKTLPNGDSETYSFDALNRATIESAQTGGASSLFNYVYGYDLASNVTSIAESYPGGLANRTVTNTYDNINRLSQEAVAASVNVTTGYAYDGANNRTGAVIVGGPNAGTYSYTYNNLNELTGDTDGTRTEAFTYDNNQNCTSYAVAGGSDNGTDIYNYDFENRLVSMTKSTAGTGAGTYNYQYDYRSRRVTRDETGAGGVLTHVIFSGGTSVAEYDGTNTTPTVEYIRGSDYGGGVGSVLYTLRGGVPSYTHADRKGNIVAKTDASGNLTFQDQYDDNGKQVATTGSTADRQKDNSKDVDPWGGINEGRRYSVIRAGDLRLFLSKDPAGMVDGPNEFIYCRDDAATYFDPEGLFIWGFFVDAGFAAYDTYSAVTAKNQTERNWAYASLGVDAAGFGTDIFDGGAGAGVAVATTGRIALHAKQAAQIAQETKQGLQIASAATHTGEATAQAADSGAGGVHGDGTGKGSSSQGGSPGGKTAEETQSAQDRGRESEQRVLKDTGNEKNTTTYSTSRGKTIPDYVNDTDVGEIKDTKTASNTNQMKAQREVAQTQGKDHIVQTGTNTKVSKPLQNSGSKIIRRDDLGPPSNK